jgi:hypothetical protein
VISSAGVAAVIDHALLEDPGISFKTAAALKQAQQSTV